MIIQVCKKIKLNYTIYTWNPKLGPCKKILCSDGLISIQVVLCDFNLQVCISIQTVLCVVSFPSIENNLECRYKIKLTGSLRNLENRSYGPFTFNK